MELQEHLTRRLAAAYRQLGRALEGLTAEQAAEGASPGWKRYRYGEGLNGSIAGIVCHVAVWKYVAAAGLTSGQFPHPSHLVSPPQWRDLLRWLDEGHELLTAAWNAVPPADLERRVLWEGHEMTVADVVSHMVEHDQYHAGQINLLRQQREHVLTDR